MAKKVPSPCIGICKFKVEGHCIGCGQTKKQKKKFKSLRSKKKREKLLRTVLGQQRLIGGRLRWERVYRRRCAKKGMPCPLDSMAE